jgi:hypothetical protein
MGRVCTVCSHQDCEKINGLLLCSESYRDIARQFNLSKDALARHKEGHIPELLLKANDIKEIAEANDSIATLEKVKSKAFELLDMAIEAADTKKYGAPSNYLREIREQVKLWAELEGKLASQQITINQQTIINNPEWIELRTLIVTALKPYPEALREVRNAIP